MELGDEDGPGRRRNAVAGCKANTPRYLSNQEEMNFRDLSGNDREGRPPEEVSEFGR
jgi:hypothetical protein